MELSTNATPRSGLPSDEEIKSVARQDRQAAAGLVVRKYRTRLFYHALSIVKDQQEAHDDEAAHRHDTRLGRLRVFVVGAV